jgi:hypothetical protein
MSYRLTDPAPVLFNLLGTARAANGSLTFYEKGTTTPTDTWSDQGLTTPNENPVPLDASGRAETEIWLDGEYTVVAKASDGSPIWTRVVAPEIAPGLAIPSLTGKTGWFLSNNGTDLVWQDILALLLPDPTGSAGYMVVVNADGTGYLLQPVPEPEDPAIDVASNNVVTFGMSTGDKWMIQKGTGTAPATGTFKTSVPVTFSPAFKSGTVPFVAITPLNTQPDGGPMVAYADGAPTASGFTPTFDVAEGDSASPNVTAPVTFLWEASGVYDG